MPQEPHLVHPRTPAICVTALPSRSRPSGRFCIVVLTIFFASILSIPVFAGSCQLDKMAEFPITMMNLRPLMTAKINDADVQFLVDSGAFYSMISAASAAEFKLATYPAPFGFYITGIGGGTANASIAKVGVFTLAGVPLHNVEFLVGGSEAGEGSVGILGQNILHIADVEYDLGQGVIRLMKPRNCSKALLAYWVNGNSTPYSVINIESTTRLKPFTTGFASINGTQIRVMFDSGAGVSTLSLKAAARVGIKPDSPGVVYAGPTYGIGRNTIRSYIAPFSSFKIGEEEIRNTRLRIADIDLPDADMLIGPDFFLSHRIYVANSQHKLYFTYNGGPVFNLSGAKYAGAAPAPTTASTASEPAQDTTSSGEMKKAAANTDDAADYSRRGTAFASRRDFEQALKNLRRACELAPDNAEYFYQRGMVYWQMKQGAAAMADFDQALKLKPDDVVALVSRAELSLQSGDKLRAGADLDSANAVASKQADLRYAMAHAYLRADLSGPAIAQYDLWINSHAADARLPEALNSRCWARALAGVDMALALKDCNAALKHADKSSAFYARVVNSRALVLMRMGEYDKSMSDYDASLKINPKDAWSWYGRGIDKRRKQKTSEGDADIAQATAIWPNIAGEFNRYGIAP
jgi:tetratricopeptide (TPR) repeat protein/predicted aspartyl protease